MLRAASKTTEEMAGHAGEYRCKCGFSAATATTFYRHTRQFKEQTAEHGRVQVETAIEDTSPARTPGKPTELEPTAASSPSTDEGTRNSSPLGVVGRLSLVGGLASLWGRGGQAQPQDTREPDSHYADDDSDSVEFVESPRDTDTPGQGTGAAGAPTSGSYPDITESLQASGNGATSGAGPHESWLSSSMRKVLGHSTSDPDANITSHAKAGRSELSGWNGRNSKISVEDVEAIILWAEPLQTAKVFGAGLYALICIRHLVNGVELLQPSSALAFAAICAIAYGFARSMFLRSASGKDAETRLEAERAFQARVEDLITAVSVRLVPLLSSTISLVARRLSSRSSKASRVWLGFCLWLVICVGELGWLSQASLALWLWAALFTLPGLYVTSRSALDALVDEGVLFVLSAVQGGQRGTLVASACLGLAAFTMVDAKLFMRMSACFVSSTGVVLWQAHRIRIKAAQQAAL